MAVKIGDKIYRNEQEQVRKNMKDIEFLKGKIKDVFKTTATLTSSSVSVALVDTNVTDDEEGWLMSDDGLLFAITGNDGTNLLISYYADLKGPQGEPGAALNIDDSTTSATKVWSSQKTNLEISKSKEPGNYITNSAPTSLGGDSYYIAITDIVNIQNAQFKAGDIVTYINSGVPDSVYKVTSSDLSGVTTDKIGEFSQGGTAVNYEMIQLSYFVANSKTLLCVLLVPEGTFSDYTATAIYNFLTTNNYTLGDDRLLRPMSGDFNGKIVRGLYIDPNYNNQIGFLVIDRNATTSTQEFVQNSNLTVKKIEFPLP